MYTVDPYMCMLIIVYVLLVNYYLKKVYPSHRLYMRYTDDNDL